ncbi:MAG: hypothetical protein RL757_2878 [Bacteroidota bacterium]|jgi:hypothetical protein
MMRYFSFFISKIAPPQYIPLKIRKLRFLLPACGVSNAVKVDKCNHFFSI